MRGTLFVMIEDLKRQLRQGATIAWVFVMPPVFFYFIGTVTGGLSSELSGDSKTPLVVYAEAPGFLQSQIDLRLRANGFEPEWQEAPIAEAQSSQRDLTFDASMTDRIVAGDSVAASFDTTASSLSRDLETIRIQRSLYTALADVVVAEASSPSPLTAADLSTLNAAQRIWQLDAGPAGQRQEIPNGFQQAVPGMMVMFTLLVLLTTGAASLAVERGQGLLRRLASAPILKSELVAGKWGARMLLAVVQIAAAIAFGTWLFKMAWGPDFAMVVLVLAAWAAFCASAGLLLGSVARTEAQAVGIGLLFANSLAALGGCWWPIEITPGWMQFVQKLTPTGWTMDALHKLISFEAGAAAALPNVAILVVASVLVALLAINRFRYQ